MPKELGVFDPEQLNALQDLFDEIWAQLTGSNLTDNEIIQAVLCH
jgi:hypothetical protein